MKLIASTILLLSLFSCVFAQDRVEFDEFGKLSCDNLTPRIGNLVHAIESYKDSKGAVIIYNGKVPLTLYNGRSKTVYPRRNEVKAEIDNIKTRIKFYNFDENRIVFIDGGFRENFTIELYHVPSGAPLPEPTPSLKTMKYRKGKAKPSCKYI